MDIYRWSVVFGVVFGEVWCLKGESLCKPSVKCNVWYGKVIFDIGGEFYWIKNVYMYV